MQPNSLNNSHLRNNDPVNELATPVESSSSSKTNLNINNLAKQTKPDYGLCAADEQTLKDYSQWSRMSDLVSPRIAAYNKHREF